MARLLLDTSVFVDHLRARDVIRSRGHHLAYSVIVRAELYAGGDERRVDAALEPHEELVVDREVAARAVRIQRTIGTDLPDALIAATALIHGLTLITRNTSDFRGIPKLRLRDAI